MFTQPTNNVVSPCKTCINADICIVYNQYSSFLTITGCKRQVETIQSVVQAHMQAQDVPVERPQRDKSIDLKQFYTAKEKSEPKLEIGRCEFCNEEDYGCKCEICGKFVCELDAIYDIDLKKTICPDCNNKESN